MQRHNFLEKLKYDVDRVWSIAPYTLETPVTEGYSDVIPTKGIETPMPSEKMTVTVAGYNDIIPTRGIETFGHIKSR